MWNIQYAVLLQQNSRDLGLLVEGFGLFEASAGKGVGMDHSRRSAVGTKQLRVGAVILRSQPA